MKLNWYCNVINKSTDVTFWFPNNFDTNNISKKIIE